MGFTTLFLELALIRYLPGNIWNLGYFPNLILIAVFIGMGVGFMFHHRVGARGSAFWMHASVWILLALLLFVEVSDPNVPGFSAWEGDIGGDLYFTSTTERAAAGSSAPLTSSFLPIASMARSGVTKVRTGVSFSGPPSYWPKPRDFFSPSTPS